MRRLWTVGIGLMMAASVWAGTIPSQITYQGTLKQSGLPATGTKTMLFRLTNQDGTQVYWSSGNQSVAVANGLFSAQLSPTGVDWQNVTPYIEVSIEGQQLSPREPVAASVYAMMSQSIVDGAVTPSKVASGYGLVPSGMIGMFETSCPAGWTVYTALQGKFPAGVDPNNAAQFTAGQSGGSLTHSHSIAMAPAHSHGGSTGGPSATVLVNAGSNARVPTESHTHIISPDGAHDHGGSTGISSSLPPYMSVVFCEKN